MKSASNKKSGCSFLMWVLIGIVVIFLQQTQFNFSLFWLAILSFLASGVILFLGYSLAFWVFLILALAADILSIFPFGVVFLVIMISFLVTVFLLRMIVVGKKTLFFLAVVSFGLIYWLLNFLVFKLFI